MVAEVKKIYEQNARQIVAMLRQAADNLEAGYRPFDIRGAVLVIAGRTREVDVYSWGELDNYSTLGILDRAKVKIHKIIGDEEEPRARSST